MFLSFYNLLTAEKTKIHMNRPGYPVAFIMCIIAFVEGILFAFFTYEILTEQFESVDENQSYIDQLKKAVRPARRIVRERTELLWLRRHVVARSHTSRTPYQLPRASMAQKGGSTHDLNGQIRLARRTQRPRQESIR
jgi:hypothetical protein